MYLIKNREENIALWSVALNRGMCGHAARRGGVSYKDFVGKPENRNHLKELGVDGRYKNVLEAAVLHVKACGAIGIQLH